MNVDQYTKLMETPDLTVYRLAIERVRFGYNTYSCIAIRDAITELYGKENYPRWSAAVIRYQQQYRMFVFRELDALFWNSAQPFKKERIAALEAMIKACKEAGATKRATSLLISPPFS